MARVFRKKRSAVKVKLAIFIIAALVLLVLISGTNGMLPAALKNRLPTEGLIGVIRYGIPDTLRASHLDEEIRIAEEAVVRATVQCYALEGRYPESMDYLAENYGLAMDRDKFVYHYEVNGENMMPLIKVFPLQEWPR
jgi:hypothetical protein